MEFYSSRGAAERAGVSIQCVHLWINRFGRSFAHKRGGRWQISSKALERHLSGRPVEENPADMDSANRLRAAADALEDGDHRKFRKQIGWFFENARWAASGHGKFGSEVAKYER